jgi:hypothetical protein
MRNFVKIIVVLISGLILYLIFPVLLKKSGVYDYQLKNFVSYSVSEHHHEDEESMAYFEIEFEQQPYRLPYDSSLKMLKLSVLLFIISFIIREFYIKKYG